MTNPSLRKGLESRYDGMESEYRKWEPHFRKLRDSVMPRKGRFLLGSSDDRGDRANTKIIDATAREALRTMQTGLHAGMTSPTRQWFKLGLIDSEASKEPDVKRWLETAQKRMYAVMAVSNIYAMFPRCYMDLGLYGAHASLLLFDFEYITHAHTFSVGEFVIADNKYGRVDQLHRRSRETVRFVVNRFGLENCSETVREAYRRNDLNQMVDLHMAIEPRLKRDPLSPLAVDKPFGVYHWECNTPNDRVLEESGFDLNRIIAPRWDVEPGDVWSHSPAMDALGDAMTLQEQHVDKATAIKKSYDPPLQGTKPSQGGRYKTFPGGVTYIDQADLRNGGLRPIYEARPDISGLLQDMAETRERIRSAFFADLFQMFTHLDRRQITAEEIARRYEEKVLMLGPVLESLNRDLLSPTIDIFFHDMVEGGLIPPAPEQIAGQEIRVEYVSMLHQAQKAAGVQQLERTIGFVGSLGQIKPSALDNLDEDAMVREFVHQVGPPIDVLHGEREVGQVRQQRAQAEQQQTMMDNAQPMANAARLISEANERGQVAPVI